MLFEEWNDRLRGTCGHYYGVPGPTRRVVNGNFSCSRFLGFVTADVYCDIEAIDRPSSAIRKDDNEYIFLYYQVSGSSFFSQSGLEGALRAGEFMLLDSTKEARMNYFCNPIQFRSIHLPRSLVLSRKGLTSRMNQTLCAIHPMNAPLRAFIENSIALQNSNVDRCMGYLLDLIDIAFSSIEERMDCGRANTGKLRFELCRDLIDRHLVDIDISVEWLSLETGVSKRQIQRDFFDHGTSFTSYVQRKRLLLAADILEQFIYSRTLPNISDVAFRVGFGDVSNFNRAFKRCFGVTPRDYLRSKTAESTVGRLAAQGLVHHRPT